MVESVAAILGITYTVSEVALAIQKRSRSGGLRGADRGSLRLLWIVITASVFVAFSLPPAWPSAAIGARRSALVAGVALFAMGVAIRWYAIIHLGRFFTVDVSIAADHRVIDTGPYRWVRHPSYSGALMAFLGLGLCIGNWGSVAVLAVPIFLVFLRRIQIEEAALLQALQGPYGEYMKRTKRLVPGVY